MKEHYPWVALPAEAAEKIEAADANSGGLRLRDASWNRSYVIRAIEVTAGAYIDVAPPKEFRALRYGDASVQGQWVKRPGSHVNLIHLDALRRGPDTYVGFERFRQLVPQTQDPGNKTGLLITHDANISDEWRNAGVRSFAAWMIERRGVKPIPLAVEPEWGLSQLDSGWPVDDMLGMSIAVVGVGSIGGAATQALASYGVGTLRLIDPDRFLWHNMVRHVLAHESVGMLKVDAMRQYLGGKWPDTSVETYVYDVVDDAHLMRTLFSSVDLILCAADGIAPRRVVSHLSRRAKKPAILACVLDDGALGEIVRLRPEPRYGCLLCLRSHLRSVGALDVEAAQELDYGTGFTHKPMTAVGSDLHLIGQLAAKAAVATLLESRHGDHTQRLPGDLATIGLRPPGDTTAPFDLARALDINWGTLPPPRPTCPTCRP